MRISVRLDPDLARRIRALQRQNGQSASRVVRELLRGALGMAAFERGWHEGIMAGRAAFERAQHAALHGIGMGDGNPDPVPET